MARPPSACGRTCQVQLPPGVQLFSLQSCTCNKLNMVHLSLLSSWLITQADRQHLVLKNKQVCESCVHYTYVNVVRVGLGIGLGVRLLAFLMVTPWQKI